MLSQTVLVSVGKEAVYVVQMCRCFDQNVFSAALSNKMIKIYELGDGCCSHVCNLVGYQSAVMDQAFKSAEEPKSLFTCHEAGTLEQWDLRNGTSTERFHHDAGLTSLAIREHVIAVGTEEGNVLFLDERKNGVLKEFSDSHASGITQVCFHPHLPNIFISASDDGMLSVFDFLHGVDEDDSFKAGQNWDAIARFGFFGKDGENLWCLSSQHGLTLWQWKHAVYEESDVGAVPYYTTPDVRPHLTCTQFPEVDYSLACVEHKEQLMVAGGSSDGNVALFDIPMAFHDRQDKEIDRFPLQLNLREGHSDIVRSFLPWRRSSAVCLTGGEDSRICIWTQDPSSQRESVSALHKLKVAVQDKKQRTAPY